MAAFSLEFVLKWHMNQAGTTLGGASLAESGEMIIFSKRLYGIPGTLIFLALTLGFGINTLRHVQSRGSPAGLVVMSIGLGLFILLGTMGWRYCLRRRSVVWVRGYFVVQIALFTLLFWLENADTLDGAGVGNLLVSLLIQCCVMGWWARGLVHGTTVLIMVIISALYLPLDRVIAPSVIVVFTNGSILLLGHLIVSEEKAREQLGETYRKLAEYAEQAEELATVKERNRLAREIHDNLGHYLTAVNMQLEAALALMETDPSRAAGSLSKAQSLTKEGLAEIRRSIAALRAAPTEDRPLHEAITQLVEETRAAGLDVQYVVEGAIRPCSAQVEMALYRIAQEGLTNIRKHAHAAQAKLELSYRDGQRISLQMRDNGAGSADASGGFGLIGIQERVKLLGGTFQIDTAKGQGFRLQVEIPT
jgi:signal transduction histidine kinase